MADLDQKVPENRPGRFYVDLTCIDCDFCREIAPRHFARHGPGRYSFVQRQPMTPEEEARCREALEGCPVEAIGDNGVPAVETVGVETS
jgi:ferredoxin